MIYSILLRCRLLPASSHMYLYTQEHLLFNSLGFPELFFKSNSWILTFRLTSIIVPGNSSFHPFQLLNSSKAVCFSLSAWQLLCLKGYKTGGLERAKLSLYDWCLALNRDLEFSLGMCIPSLCSAFKNLHGLYPSLYVLKDTFPSKYYSSITKVCDAVEWQDASEAD